MLSHLKIAPPPPPPPATTPSPPPHPSSNIEQQQQPTSPTTETTETTSDMPSTPSSNTIRPQQVSAQEAPPPRTSNFNDGLNESSPLITPPPPPRTRSYSGEEDADDHLDNKAMARKGDMLYGFLAVVRSKLQFIIPRTTFAHTSNYIIFRR